MKKALSGISNLLHTEWEDGKRTVEEAVFIHDVKRVRKVLHNCNNEQVIRSALCAAVTLDDTSMLKSILDQIKHSNVSGNLYQQKHLQSDLSPLHVACRKDKEESVSLLLKTGFTANVLDEYNSTPLFWAIHKKHRSVADVLLSIDDIDVNSVTCDLPPDILYECRQMTVLMCACYVGDFQSIIGICRHNPLPNVVGDYGLTPLHTVCSLGNMDCVRSLLSCGADVNARDTNYMTPLYVACWHGRTDIVEVLLQSGAQVNQKSDEETYIAFSFKYAHPTEQNKEVKFAAYPLLAAVENCQPEVFSLLISHGAKIDIIKTLNNVTALHVACSEGTLGMVKTLVNNDSCVNAETYSGQTPLFYCLRNSSFHVGPHVYPTHEFNIGCTCDQFTLESYEEGIREGNDIMEYLIKQGATLSCKDDSGRTPLEHAMMTYRTFSTFILLKYGGRISAEHLDKFPWNLCIWSGPIQFKIPNVHLFRLLLRSNFEFRRFLPVYLEKLRDLKPTESFLSFLKEVEQPLSLKDQCRISIRNMISTDTGVQFIRSINTLRLPKLLQGFLMFDDFDQSVCLPTEFIRQT